MKHWLFLLLLLGGCSAEYSLPPSACDDYCHAVQRAACSSDDPAGCVRDCEKTDTEAVRSACEPEWRARNDCFLDADQSKFVCEEDESRIPDICLAERRALSECLAPGSGPCLDECVRQVDACGAELPDCETSCSHPEPQCGAASLAYQACLVGYPVECREWFQEETRAPEDVPCRDEALVVLACGK